MKPIKFVRMMGKVWKFQFVPQSSLPKHEDKDYYTDGACDPHDKVGKRMRVGKHLKGKSELETIIHEGQHACNESLAEPYVEQSSADLANLLWRLGYRRIAEES